MTFTLRRAWLGMACLAACACGNTSGPVLERVDPRVPPDFTHRVDVFLVSSVRACAIGRACASRSSDSCFYVRSANNTTYFEPTGLEFVAEGDARIDAAAQSACFQLELDEGARESASASVRDLRNSVFQLSEGRIDLDLRIHVVALQSGTFKRWEGGTGIFFQPGSLEELGLSEMSAASDFAFAITGEADQALGVVPKIDPCGGTNWQAQGGLGGAAYTWLSSSCVSTAALRWHFLYQSYFALRDVMNRDDEYDGAYPACGQGAPDPKRWFPRPSDCSLDPDAPNCGRANCDETSFAAHVLTAHWPSAPGLVGNHCRNGQADYDETGPDVGGVCSRIGR